MLTIEELEEIFEEIRTGESDDSPFMMKGSENAKELYAF